MDQRLIPINGLIALLQGEGRWPDLLRAQGFQRHQLEVPISTPLGDLSADALIYRLDPDLILLCEGKSGRNIEEALAKKYMAVDLDWLRRKGVVPPQLRERKDTIAVRVLFVGQEEHRADLESGLRQLNIDAPLLTIGPKRVRLSGASGILGLNDFDLEHSGGVPPARIPIDHQSPDQDLLEVLIPEVVAAQARNEEFVLVESLAERVLPEWPILAHGAREEHSRRAPGTCCEDLLQARCAASSATSRSVNNTRGRIVIEATPATRDPRGRTQAWQAQRRRAGAALQRRLKRESAGQLSLDELADKGGLAEE